MNRKLVLAFIVFAAIWFGIQVALSLSEAAIGSNTYWGFAISDFVSLV